MNKQSYNLVLASKSPRRQELLRNAGYTFSVFPANIDEDKIENEYKEAGIDEPFRLVEKLSLEKSKHIANTLRTLSLNGADISEYIDASVLTTKILAADTVVSVDGKILGKPKDKDEAREMLKTLSGRSHEVYTGYTILKMTEGPCGGFLLPEENEYFFGADKASDASSDAVITKSVCTKVNFYPLTDEDIEWYIGTGDPFDKAGGYGIQSLAVRFVEGICGDYNNVVGLPLAEVMRSL